MKCGLMLGGGGEKKRYEYFEWATFSALLGGILVNTGRVKEKGS
jgi:hypothetical protein